MTAAEAVAICVLSFFDCFKTTEGGHRHDMAHKEHCVSVRQCLCSLWAEAVAVGMYFTVLLI